MAGKDQTAAIDEDHVLAEILDQVELMTGEHDCGALRGPGAEHLDQRLHPEGVQAAEWLVEHQQFGPVDQRRGQLDALLVTVGERLDLVIGPLDQTELGEQLGGRRARLRLVEPVQAAVVDELVDDCHLRVEAPLFGHVAESVAHLGCQLFSPPADRAPVGCDDAEDASHRRGLARPIGAEEAGDTPGLDGEAQPIQRGHGAEPPIQIVKFEHALRR